MFSCTPVPRSSLLPAKSWTHHAGSTATTPRSTTFVIKEDPFAFTEASSSMWSSNDPIRVLEVAKRQRLSALTEKVEEKRREDRANIEEIDHSQLPSSSTTSDQSGTSSSRRVYSSFRFTTSLEPVLPNDLEEEDAMDVARNSAKRKIEGDVAEDKLHKSKDQKEPKRRRIEIPAGPAAPPAAPSSIQPTTSSSPPKPKVHKRRNASPSTSSIAATRPISSSPRVQDTRRERVLATTATVATAPSKHDSPSPSGSSPQPSTPPINRPPIKFATPQRNLALKQRASDSTGSPTAATVTADSTSPKPTTPERPSATRFRVADRFVATSSSPRSTTSGSLAPPNLGELTRMLRSSQSSAPSSTTSPSSQLLSSSPFKQLRLTSSPSSSSSSYSSSSSSPSSSLLPTSSSSFASTHQRSPRSPEKQLSSTVAQEMRRFRRTQETRVRDFQAEVRQGLSPFRGRKLFPEPEIDDDAILPPIVKPEPRDEEDTNNNGIDNNNHNHNHSEEQDHRPLHHTEAAGLADMAAKTTGQEERHSGGCAHNSGDAIVLD